MDDVRAAFERHLAAFNDQDLDGVLAGPADDAGWVTGTDAFHGRAELTDLFRGAFAVAPVLLTRAMLVDGDRVAAELTERIVRDGASHEFSIAGFYRIDGGRITSAKIYRDGSADLPD